jgi:hypothetical protein
MTRCYSSIRAWLLRGRLVSLFSSSTEWKHMKKALLYQSCHPRSCRPRWHRRSSTTSSHRSSCPPRSCRHRWHRRSGATSSHRSSCPPRSCRPRWHRRSSTTSSHRSSCPPRSCRHRWHRRSGATSSHRSSCPPRSCRPRWHRRSSTTSSHRGSCPLRSCRHRWYRRSGLQAPPTTTAATAPPVLQVARKQRRKPAPHPFLQWLPTDAKKAPKTYNMCNERKQKKQCVVPQAWLKLGSLDVVAALAECKRVDVEDVGGHVARLFAWQQEVYCAMQ